VPSFIAVEAVVVLVLLLVMVNGGMLAGVPHSQPAVDDTFIWTPES
jgi:hypothetical protein